MSTVLNVLIIGHSHAYWWEQFVDAAGLFANFVKLGYKCKSSFIGIRGATVGSFRGAGIMARIRQHSISDVRWQRHWLSFPALNCIGPVSSRYGAVGYRCSTGWSLPN